MGRKLVIDYVNVRKVVFGERTELCDGILAINKDELISMANSQVLGSFDIKIA